jgi:hypothetical protein
MFVILAYDIIKIYILAPSKLAFTVIINGPSHIPINRLVKASYELPLVLNAHKLAVNNVIQSGPHISHYFLSLS